MELGVIGFVLTLISFIHGSFASLISLIVSIVLIYHQCRNRLKREERINLLLFTTIYFFSFMYILTLTSFNAQTLLGDLYQRNFDSTWCTFRGYLIPVTCSALYQAFATQALFRLCRIVYSNRRWLQFFWFYIILIPAELLGSFVGLCPILIWGDIDYLPTDNYCFVPFTKPRGVIWLIFTTYGIPLTILFLIYLRITIFIRHLPDNQATALRRRQQRDLIAIRRIFINVALLMILVMPGTVLILMRYISGTDYPLTFRILWLGAEMSVAVLSVAMILLTPQLKNIFIDRWRQNRVTLLTESVQRGPVTTNQ